MLLQLPDLVFQRLAVLDQHFHPFRELRIPFGSERRISLDFLNWHPGCFQSFDKGNPGNILVRITKGQQLSNFGDQGNIRCRRTVAFAGQ